MKKENQRQDQIREHITKHWQDYLISLQCQQHTVPFTFVPKWLTKNNCYSMELDLGCSVDPFHRLIRRLIRWSSLTVGTVRNKMAISRELISGGWNLTKEENHLRMQLKIAYNLASASLDQTIARQWARLNHLKDGDANTSFYHHQCTYHRHKNLIYNITMDDRVLIEHKEMAKGCFLDYHGCSEPMLTATTPWTSHYWSSPRTCKTSTKPSSLRRFGM
jgi:hypothetical protein